MERIRNGFLDSVWGNCIMDDIYNEVLVNLCPDHLQKMSDLQKEINMGCPRGVGGAFLPHTKVTPAKKAMENEKVFIFKFISIFL